MLDAVGRCGYLGGHRTNNTTEGIMSFTWKVFERSLRTGKMEMVASCRYAEQAAALAGMTGAGVIKAHGRIVWRDGWETMPVGVGPSAETTDTAADSWDGAAMVMVERVKQHRLERINKQRRIS